MNFVKNEKTLKTLLTTKGGKMYSGNYIYSRDRKDNTLKIGMSQRGIWRRLKQHKSCYPYPNEFFLKYVIISLDGDYIKGKKSTTRAIEDALHTNSKQFSTVKMTESKESEGLLPREYRLFSTNTQYYNLIKQTLNEYRKMWDYLIVFSENSWNIIPNNRIIKTPIKSISQLKPKRTTAKPEIDSMPLNKTKLILPKDLKVGDTMPRSENWESFKVIAIKSKKHIVAKFKKDKNIYDIYI